MTQVLRNIRQFLTHGPLCQAWVGLFRQFTEQSSFHDSYFCHPGISCLEIPLPLPEDVNLKSCLNPLQSPPESECKACCLVDIWLCSVLREPQVEFSSQGHGAYAFPFCGELKRERVESRMLAVKRENPRGRLFLEYVPKYPVSSKNVLKLHKQVCL